MTTIYLREFRRLHYFINATFEVEAKLHSCRQSGSQSIPTAIAGVEANAHSSVPSNLTAESRLRF